MGLKWVNMRQASRRQNSMRRESADTPLLQKLEIFSDQGISARRSLAHICAKDLGARFPTAEIPQRRFEGPPLHAFANYPPILKEAHT